MGRKKRPQVGLAPSEVKAADPTEECTDQGLFKMPSFLSPSFAGSSTNNHSSSSNSDGSSGRQYNHRRLLDRDGHFGQSRGRLAIRKLMMKSEWNALYAGDWFHSLLDAPTSRIVCFLLAAYLAVVLAFAAAYFCMSVLYVDCNLGIATPTQAFIFSLQTMATIGFGVGEGDVFFGDCSCVAATLFAQVCLKMVGDAVIIGVIYSRISRPNKRATTVLFSHHAVIRRIRGRLYFMFQLCELRKHQLTEAHVRLYAIRHERDPVAGGEVALFQTCAMRLNHPNDELGGNLLLALPQVVVHELDQWSPLMPPPLWATASRLVRWVPRFLRDESVGEDEDKGLAGDDSMKQQVQGASVPVAGASPPPKRPLRAGGASPLVTTTSSFPEVAQRSPQCSPSNVSGSKRDGWAYRESPLTPLRTPRKDQDYGVVEGKGGIAMTSSTAGAKREDGSVVPAADGVPDYASYQQGGAVPPIAALAVQGRDEPWWPWSATKASADPAAESDSGGSSGSDSDGGSSSDDEAGLLQGERGKGPTQSEPALSASERQAKNRDLELLAEQHMVSRYMTDRCVEVVAIVEGTDAATGGVVQARHSYSVAAGEVVWNHSFVPCVKVDAPAASASASVSRRKGRGRRATGAHEVPGTRHRESTGAAVIDFSLFHKLRPVALDAPYSGAVSSQL